MIIQAMVSIPKFQLTLCLICTFSHLILLWKRWLLKQHFAQFCLHCTHPRRRSLLQLVELLFADVCCCFFFPLHRDRSHRHRNQISSNWFRHLNLILQNAEQTSPIPAIHVYMYSLPPNIFIITVFKRVLLCESKLRF